MSKSLKTLAIIMIILSIIFFIGGICSSKLAEANRGLKYSTGYTRNGAFVATGNGVAGANKKGENAGKTLSAVFYTFSGISLIAGISATAKAKKVTNTNVIRKYGIILEKQTNSYESVLVEFEDGIRKKLLVEPPLIVAKGDEGFIGFKGNLLVEFSKK